MTRGRNDLIVKVLPRAQFGTRGDIVIISKIVNLRSYNVIVLMWHNGHGIRRLKLYWTKARSI